MVGVVGKAIKGFGKALKTAKRNKASKQVFDQVTGKPFSKKTIKHMQTFDKRHAAKKKKGWSVSYIPVKEVGKSKEPYQLMELWKKGKK